MIIQSKRVWISGQFMEVQIELKAGRIEKIRRYGELSPDRDYGNDRILPGFIDIHTHGSYGFDTNDANPEGLRDWMKRITEEGVTAILPTTVTQSEDVLIKALENVAAVAASDYQGAEILGIHFEGPFLNMTYKGAQPPEHIAKGTIAMFDKYQAAANGLIKVITMAPDEDHDYSLTRHVSQSGVVVSMGHSAATYEQAAMAIANGATSMTHVFNGMTGFHHRNPGLVGAALRFREVYGEVIADGQHSHFAALNSFFNAKGRDYAIMITDSLCAKHCTEGSFSLGGHPYEISPEGSAYLTGTNTLAGSTLWMNVGLKNLVENASIPFDYAVNSCTINPARCLGVDDRKGRIAAGYDGDLVVLHDDYSVAQTYCRGTAMKQ